MIKFCFTEDRYRMGIRDTHRWQNNIEKKLQGLQLTSV